MGTAGQWVLRLLVVLAAWPAAFLEDIGAAAYELPRDVNGSQPIHSRPAFEDTQIKLKPKCFDCLLAFCDKREPALPATNRYCCKDKVLESINKEISCSRFSHLGSSAVEVCNTHKSDWNICVNLVLNDLCEGCESWAEDFDLEPLFTRIENHGNIIRPSPSERDKTTPVIPVVRGHECAQDPVCDRHGKERALHVGNYTMPAYILKQWKLIALSPDFDRSLFSAECGPEMRGENNTCTQQMSQLDLRNQQCKEWQNCSQTYISMLDLADFFNQHPDYFDPPLSFVWAPVKGVE